MTCSDDDSNANAGDFEDGTNPSTKTVVHHESQRMPTVFAFMHPPIRGGKQV